MVLMFSRVQSYALLSVKQIFPCIIFAKHAHWLRIFIQVCNAAKDGAQRKAAALSAPLRPVPPP